MNEYLNKLTALHRRAAEVGLHKDPDLSPEGQEKADARARAALKAEFDALVREFEKEAAETKRVAEDAIPKGSADTQQHWQRARMLLDAGATLSEVVATADAPMLHAIQEWGPTYMQAAHIKARPEGMQALAAEQPDPQPLRNSIRNRWAQILDGFAPGRITRGVEAEVAEAQFQIRAKYLGQILQGQDTGTTHLEVAMAAQIAGQQARNALQPESQE